MDKDRSLIVIIFTIILIAFITVSAVNAYVPPQRIRAMVERIFYTFDVTTRGVIISVGVLIIVTVGAGTVWVIAFLWANGSIWVYNKQIKGAEALKARREAGHSVVVAAPGSQVYFSDFAESGLTVTHKPGHLAAGWMNGGLPEWTGEQMQQWAFYQVQQSINKPPRVINAPELPAPDLPPLPTRVNLREYVSQPSLGAIFLGLGRIPGEMTPRPIIAPFDDLVHVATGGTSGFGKSTFMQAVAYQALNAPGSRPVLMDAEGITFTPFEGHPALFAKLVDATNGTKDIELTIDLLLDELNKRRKLYQKYPGVFKISQYNQVAEEPLPAIPIFLDEFGIVATPRIIEKIDLLSKGGRKAGLYLILGSQTWNASQFPTTLRANLSTTIQFRARDKSQSRILLEDSAAANLTIPGRAYAKLSGVAGLVEMQAPMVSDSELTVPAPVAALPDPMTARALALYQSGASLSEIAREVLKLNREVGGRDRKIIKRILGLDPDTDPDNERILPQAGG